MKKKTFTIEAPVITLAGLDPDGKYCFEVRFTVKDGEYPETHQRGIGIKLDPEKLWKLHPQAQVPYVDAKFHEVVDCPSYEEEFSKYYDEVEVIKEEHA